MWGENDPVFSPDAARATADFVTGPFESHGLEGVGHWVLEHTGPELLPLGLRRGATGGEDHGGGQHEADQERLSAEEGLRVEGHFENHV